MADDTAAFRDAISKGSFVVPPGNHNLSGDICIPSNRSIWVQKGAVVTNTGGRFTSYVPGGGHIDFRIDGVMSFPKTATAPSMCGLAGWEYNGEWNNRGVIELGGSVAKPAVNIHVYGTGEVYSDYVWPSVTPTAFTDINEQMNRKGVCLFNAVKSSIEDLDVHNVYGEAVYFQSINRGDYDVRLVGNRVHEVAFNGVNVNALGGQGFVIEDNYIQNAWQGIEFSAGRCDSNHIICVHKGILTGGGGGSGPLLCRGNIIKYVDHGLDFSFNPDPVENVIVTGNVAHAVKGTAFAFDNISNYVVTDNIAHDCARKYYFSPRCGAMA